MASASATLRDLFDSIARRYDLANRVLSMGLDRGWRRAVAEEVLRDNPERVLDMCSGTADQALAVLGAKQFRGRVVCTDISPRMLRRGHQKIQRQTGREGPVILSDVHRLAIRDAGFDCAMVSFGVRNFGNLQGGLREIRRVLRPGGKIVILEFSRPANPLMWRLYRFYLLRVLPFLGGLLTGQKDAYRYLASSIEEFCLPGRLQGSLEAAGFRRIAQRSLCKGVVAVTWAIK